MRTPYNFQNGMAKTELFQNKTKRTPHCLGEQRPIEECVMPVCFKICMFLCYLEHFCRLFPLDMHPLCFLKKNIEHFILKNKVKSC